MAGPTRDRSSVSIGIIGMGDMGRLYSERISKAGWRFVPIIDWYIPIAAHLPLLIRVNACDRDENYEALRDEFKGEKTLHSEDASSAELSEIPNITILRNGHFVSRTSDFILYSVEAENIERVVAAYGACKISSCN